MANLNEADAVSRQYHMHMVEALVAERLHYREALEQLRDDIASRRPARRTIGFIQRSVEEALDV